MTITVGKLAQDGGEYDHLALHGDAMLALVARKGTEIEVVDIGGEGIRSRVSGLAAKIDRASFSFDGTKALAQLADGTLQVWDVATGNASAVIPPADGPIAAAAFRAGDTHVALVHESGTGRICTTSGEEVATFEAANVLNVVKKRAARIAMPDDRRLFIGVSSEDMRLPTVAVLDLQTHQIDTMDLGFLKGKPVGRFQSVYVEAFSRDGSRMLCADGGLFPGHGWWSEYELVDMTGPRRLELEGTGGAALKFAEFSAAGDLFAIAYFPSSGAHCRIRVVDATSGAQRHELQTRFSAVRGVAISSGTGRIVVMDTSKSVLTYEVLTPPS